ncbi:winged helix-turn-helix transcriptional regulator [Catenulispora sp. NF23]|uniref:MarR family winged helix-turn-helix transcriptional regulator n=1 Tax=Catenulispora pinistramenti TaxID=2705254 RepID=UPI001BA75E0D|nr:MarR family winged helix-turn-helix transcriptional regulator [Catenulispora pinistramenti]MBS2537978.1 winged helix-turn-helix transcriptional regulator [Catenulispora pinistramenti]
MVESDSSPGKPGSSGSPGNPGSGNPSSRSDPDTSGTRDTRDTRGGPADHPGFLLWRVTLSWQREIAAVLAPLDLTHVQFVLLACTYWLNEQGLVPNQATVAEQAGTDVKMTSQVIRTLETKGLITREVDPADTRARRLRVTPIGADLAPRAMAAVEATDAVFFDPVTSSHAISMLTKLAHIEDGG